MKNALYIFGRYFLVGGAAAVTDIGFFYVFAKVLGWNYLVVGAGGFVIATGLNYLLSVRFVFRSGARFEKRRELTLVYLVSIVGLIVHQLLLYLAFMGLMWPLLLAKVFATGGVFFWNFSARHFFVFRSQ